MFGKALLKDSLLYGVTDLVAKGIAALCFPLFTHYLSVDQFGILALITIIGSLAGLVIEFGINNAVQIMYFEKKTREDQKALVSTGLIIQAAIGVITVTVLIGITYLFKDFFYNRFQIKWIWVVMALLIVIPNSLIRFTLNILRLHYKPLVFGLITTTTNLLWMFLALYLMSTTNWGLGAYFFANLVVVLLILPFAILAIRSDVGNEYSPEIKNVVVKLAYPFVFSNVAYWLYGSIDRWILAEYSNIFQVGLYSVGYKLAVVVAFVNAAFSQAWSPILYKSINKDEKEGVVFINKVASIYLFFISIVCCVLILFSFEIFSILTPSEYWPASICAAFIITALFFSATTQFTLIGVSVRKKTRFINTASWIAVIANIILNLFLAKYLGAIGAGIAMIGTYMIITGIYNHFSKKVFTYYLKTQHLVWPVIYLFIANAINYFGSYYNVNSTIWLLGIKIFTIIIMVLVFFKKSQLSFKMIFETFKVARQA
ncbi:MAG: oligosaccharide flippase family protein [Bacteroidetes bacterium]|nr:oligosaccharide flippase family protein [Bacteroidota bacterium]MBS1931528.1 oligosaccharide flippase family protein [Bacteroidota bacterium]